MKKMKFIFNLVKYHWC